MPKYSQNHQSGVVLPFAVTPVQSSARKNKLPRPCTATVNAMQLVSVGHSSVSTAQFVPKAAVLQMAYT